ncbi:alanine--tRNA ligase [Enterobacteriaceae endosymbiont of Donacia tomentosa]|uniref:alanine--tRNA ligase n=1 Tax=Enterobacteriaceae endosymbiont of Donacia tomentosa TaxID=2675787 RepID=UPI00144938A1|nr:alanine--tRNA ligase [Enterobacteriaceae endosymbiont of Donacia tomentosa]QJC31490.1 alanine--tRNA ligase [Enterobacteriaceae endosymbiont of Donacia tomentosa]
MRKKTREISQIFLNFFHKKKHKIIEGSSLLPYNDPTLLFTNAGMNQFKEYFLGHRKSPFPRITTIQKCIRVGGKHNDLQNVGFTNRHHTFFEMLGNFSFGDYFKKEAISFAWELLTEKFNLEKKKIFVTVYHTDKETYDIWYKDISLNKKNIIIIGDKNNIDYNSDNFWQMSDTGPCGPSTEIFYDLGSHLKGNILHNFGDRFIEIWNIVFIQFNKDFSGNLIPLSIKSVDTGMGLERISSVLEKVDSNYEITFFKELIEDISIFIKNRHVTHNSFKVIADHIRASIYLISEGVLPSNESRGYVLRRIIRRAINHGKILGEKKLFFYKLVKIYIKHINNIEKINLCKKYKFIKRIIKKEEEHFNIILEKGTILLNKEIKKLKTKNLPGEKIFYLYDTFGLSLSLIKDICMQKNINCDIQEFEKYMEIQKQKSKNNSVFNKKINIYYKNKISKFYGYTNFSIKSTVLDIYYNGSLVKKIKKGDKAEIILDITSFYGEAGGQIGDTGFLEKDKDNIFQVNNTKIKGNLIIHIGEMILGSLEINDALYSNINVSRRFKITRNHTATHLLHASLRQEFGTLIKQKGSLITEHYLRFDFSYQESLLLNDIFKIEKIVNNYIFQNISIKIYEKIKKEIKKEDNIISLHHNKYDDIVKIVDIKNISRELCCGTHVNSTNQIGFFMITKFLNIANGVKRIHAVTHNLALEYIQKKNNQIKIITNLFKTDEDKIIESIILYKKKNNILLNNIKELEKYILLKERKILLRDNIIINNINLIISRIYNFNPKLLHHIIKNLVNKFEKTIIVLSTKWEKKIFLIIKITKNISNFISAIEIISNNFDKNICKIGGCASIAQINTDINKDKYLFNLSKIRTFILNKINKSN